MAASFAAYASQYLTRQPQGSGSMSASQPMFFSFSTDDGSRAGHGVDTDLNDLDDPHLRESGLSRVSEYAQKTQVSNNDDDDDDPYLRLDEDEQAGRSGFGTRYPQSVPLIQTSDNGSVRSESPKGWLAHLASSPMRARTPSPSRSDSTDSGPPPDLFGPTPVQPPPRTYTVTRDSPPSLSLTQSLLPRDGRARPLDVFSLPDPRHVSRGRRKYHDAIWTAVWCTGVSLCVFFSVLLLFVTNKPNTVPKGRSLPYTTLLHTVPMLTILTLLSALAAYAHIFLLKIFVRPVMVATSFFVPATLFISAVWAFVGSFMWDGDKEPTWGETVGLRLFSLIPLTLSVITGRRLLNLTREIHTTSSTLTLTTHLLLANPFLLALSPAILLIMLIASIPFLTLVFRLLLIGYMTQPNKGAWEWHLYAWANWAIFGAIAVWLWSWAVARGIMRMTCASVIGAWYFADPDAYPPPPMSTHTIHAALVRSTGSSLGTTILSALILTAIRLLTFVTLLLQRAPMYLPARALFIASGMRLAVGYLETVTTALSKYALVYAGLTGDPFFPSARRAQALTKSVEAKAVRGVGRDRSVKGMGKEPPLTLLTVTPLTLTFPFALTTYLFVAHTLDAPDDALGAALLAAGVTALVGLFCVGLVKDTADTLYICYCIDKDMGARRREEVFVTFEYNSQSANQPQPGRRTQQHPGRHPEQIVPLSQDAQPPRHTSPLSNRPGTNQNPKAYHHQHSSPPQNHRQQHQRVSSGPRQQLTPSASALQRPAPLARPAVIEDDPDPFQRSFAGDERMVIEDENLYLRRSRSPSPPSSLSPPRKSAPPRRSTGSPGRMLTSAELNMKSHIYLREPSSSPEPEQSGGVKTSMVSGMGMSDSSRIMGSRSRITEGSNVIGQSSRMTETMTSDNEDEDEPGSQFFPGSGFF